MYTPTPEEQDAEDVRDALCSTVERFYIRITAREHPYIQKGVRYDIRGVGAERRRAKALEPIMSAKRVTIRGHSLQQSAIRVEILHRTIIHDP